MPLNNLNLPAEVVKMFENLPLDETCTERNATSYQTKVDIYDSKCSGCGFARIVVHTRASNNKPMIFHTIEDALKYAKGLRDCVERTCSYPDDLVVVNNKVIYPSVIEIVNNTCMFWRESKLNIPPDDEKSFIEIIIETEEQIIKAVEGIAVGREYERLSKE